MIVKFFGILRDAAHKAFMEIHIEGEKPVGEILSIVASSRPELDDILYDEDGAIHGSVVVTVNGLSLAGKDISEVTIHDDDEVAIFPALSGGTLAGLSTSLS